MPNLFSAKEMIEVAIREEQTGAVYYRALADATESEGLAEFARSVAKMEDEHAAKFRALLKSVGACEPTRGSYTAECESYMSYLLEGRIFPAGQDGVKLAKRQRSDKAAVETAMELERNTLLFYLEMIQFVPEQHRAMLDDIIAEERKHVTDLATYRDEHF